METFLLITIFVLNSKIKQFFFSSSVVSQSSFQQGLMLRLFKVNDMKTCPEYPSSIAKQETRMISTELLNNITYWVGRRTWQLWRIFACSKDVQVMNIHSSQTSTACQVEANFHHAEIKTNLLAVERIKKFASKTHQSIYFEK